MEDRVRDVQHRRTRPLYIASGVTVDRHVMADTRLCLDECVSMIEMFVSGWFREDSASCVALDGPSGSVAFGLESRGVASHASRRLWHPRRNLIRLCIPSPLFLGHNGSTAGRSSYRMTGRFVNLCTAPGCLEYREIKSSEYLTSLLVS